MKSDMVKVTANGRADVAKLTDLANKIENLMNTDNANMICSFQDPNIMVSQIQDKLLNRFRVLPEMMEYSTISEFEVPNWNQRLEMLQNDIQRRKMNITSALSVPQEFLNDGQNASNYRWDIISRNQHFSDALVQFMVTISHAIKQFCTAYVFRKTGKYIRADSWKHHFNAESYLYAFQQQSRVQMLGQRITDLQNVLLAADQLSGLPFINRSKFISYMHSELDHIDPKLASCLLFTSDRVGQTGGGGGAPGEGGAPPEEGNGQGFSRPQERLAPGTVIEAVAHPGVPANFSAARHARDSASEYVKYLPGGNPAIPRGVR
jgi:hypothetical protein